MQLALTNFFIKNKWLNNKRLSVADFFKFARILSGFRIKLGANTYIFYSFDEMASFKF